MRWTATMLEDGTGEGGRSVAAEGGKVTGDCESHQ
jgi:hypothetical protein